MASIHRPAARTAPKVFRVTVRAHLRSLLLLVALQVADVISTHLALSAGFYEANPIPAAVLAVAGEGGMVALKALATILFLVAVWRLQGRFRIDPWRAVGVFNLVMLVAVVSNTAQLL